MTFAFALIVAVVIGYFFVKDLWGAFTEGVVHAKGYPYRRDTNPTLFWVTVTMNTIVLMVVVAMVAVSAAALGS